LAYHWQKLGCKAGIFKKGAFTYSIAAV